MSVDLALKKAHSKTWKRSGRKPKAQFPKKRGSPAVNSEITIILDRLRSAHNTGNIFRLAEAVGAREIICCGSTPAPPHPKLQKTAMGADRIVPTRSFPDADAAIKQLRSEEFRQILAVETGDDAEDAWDYPYRFPLALVFGNEALGIPAETISLCDGIICLPMLGIKASINVGNCAAAVLYAALHRYSLNKQGNVNES